MQFIHATTAVTSAVAEVWSRRVADLHHIGHT